MQLKAGTAGVRVSCSDRISEAEPQLPTAEICAAKNHSSMLSMDTVEVSCRLLVPLLNSFILLDEMRPGFLTQQSHHNDSSVILCIPSLRLVAPLLL